MRWLLVAGALAVSRPAPADTSIEVGAPAPCSAAGGRRALRFGRNGNTPSRLLLTLYEKDRGRLLEIQPDEAPVRGYLGLHRPDLGAWHIPFSGSASAAQGLIDLDERGGWITAGRLILLVYQQADRRIQLIALDERTGRRLWPADLWLPMNEEPILGREGTALVLWQPGSGGKCTALRIDPETGRRL
jgi:hypothetical protein